MNALAIVLIVLLLQNALLVKAAMNFLVQHAIEHAHPVSMFLVMTVLTAVNHVPSVLEVQHIVQHVLLEKCCMKENVSVVAQMVRINQTTNA